jgi:carbon starvation protein
MNGLTLMLTALLIYVLGYRFYSAFISAKVLTLNDENVTPAHKFKDGHNFVPMNKWILFGHHFAAIAGAGPLVGPVLAAQFGYAPGFFWLVLGAVLAGCVHDFVTLVASVRHNGRSIAEIAREEIGKVSGITSSIAVLFIVTIALAGLGLVVVNALAESPWGTFTIAMTIPIAIGMGLYMFKIKPGSIVGPSITGVILLIACVVGGRWIALSSVAKYFTFNHHELTVLMALYGFAASVLPVWLLLAPRDYLSCYMKLGTVFALVVGVLIVNPDLKMPAITEFAKGGGPIVPGKLFPFVFITIACGAISGFHSLVSSGTTPKMVDKESHTRFIGYGGMVMESLVGVVALIAACALYPGDYFAINLPIEKFEKLGIPIVHLPELSKEVGENVQGRSGGAVSLAVGMAQIFSSIPGMKSLMSYWYHFAIMFEALFILTTIDAGTRIGRFLLQEFLGNFNKKFSNTSWLPGSLLTTTVMVFLWAYFIYTGSVSTIWPMFGIANQLLATCALAIGTTFIVNSGKKKYFWVTFLPMCFVAVTTLSAGYLSIRDNFLPLTKIKEKALQGYLNTALVAVMMLSVVIIIIDSLRRCIATLRGKPLPPKSSEKPEIKEGAVDRCC